MLIQGQFGIIQNLQTFLFPKETLGWDFFCHFLQQNDSNTDELDWLSAMDLCMALINMYVSYRAQ